MAETLGETREAARGTGEVRVGEHVARDESIHARDESIHVYCSRVVVCRIIRRFGTQSSGWM